MQIERVARILAAPPSAIAFYLAITWCLGPPNANTPCLALALKPSTRPSPTLCPSPRGSTNSRRDYIDLSLGPPSCFVTMLAPSTCPQTRFSISTPSISRSIFTLFVIEWHLVKCAVFTCLRRISSLISSPRDLLAFVSGFLV
jgi:hypothetical protein